MILKDKINSDIITKFQEAIKKTRETGKEHGFFLCIDDQKLSTSKFKTGVAHQITLESPLVACPGKNIQGDFHTHTYLSYVEKIKPNLSEEEVKKHLNKEHMQYVEEIGIKELTIDSPSPKDLLKEILYKCSGISQGTTCVISDMGNNNVECWTVKNPSKSVKSKEECKIAYNKLFKGDKEKDLVMYDKHTISLFNKELIDIKRNHKK